MFAPDLVIMDIQLPHVSGIDLIEAMQKDPVLSAIPVMAVTAYAGKGDEERILQAGARGYLSKPVSVMKFLEAVRAIIG
jgi:two-component system cell cycle response regulator DivK